MSKINLTCEEPHGVVNSEKFQNSGSLFVLSKDENDLARLNVSVFNIFLSGVIYACPGRLYVKM